MTIWMETLVGKASKQKWNKVLYIKCTENDSTPLVFVFSWWNLEYIDIVGIYGILVPPYARYFVNSSPKNVLCRLDEISLMALENGKENFWLSLNNFAIFSPLIRVLFCESSSPKNALCQVWLKFTPGLWRMFSNVIAPWKKGVVLHLNKLLFPITQECFVWILAKIGPVVLVETKIWKVYDYNDDDRQRTSFDLESSPEPSDQVSHN